MLKRLPPRSIHINLQVQSIACLKCSLPYRLSPITLQMSSHKGAHCSKTASTPTTCPLIDWVTYSQYTWDILQVGLYTPFLNYTYNGHSYCTTTTHWMLCTHGNYKPHMLAGGSRIVSSFTSVFLKRCPMYIQSVHYKGFHCITKLFSLNHYSVSSSTGQQRWQWCPAWTSSLGHSRNPHRNPPRPRNTGSHTPQDSAYDPGEFLIYGHKLWDPLLYMYNTSQTFW